MSDYDEHCSCERCMAYQAGRRAGITEAADNLDAFYGSEYVRLVREDGRVLHDDEMFLSGIDFAESRVRSLLTATRDADQ